MLTDQQRKDAAAALMRADADRKPIPQLSKTYPDMTLEDAYAVQGLWAQALIDKGDRRVGTKIGLTSRAMQMASNFNEPDYGFLMDSMLLNDGAVIPAGRFSAPRLEVELAFVLGEDLEGPTARVHDVMRAVEFVTPAKFAEHREYALALGFVHVASGPMVRSSYHADEFNAPATSA